MTLGDFTVLLRLLLS